MPDGNRLEFPDGSRSVRVLRSATDRERDPLLMRSAIVCPDAKAVSRPPCLDQVLTF